MRSLKIVVLVLFLTSFQNVLSQSDWNKFEKIKAIKAKTVAEISNKITKPYPDELDKIKAIYYWVAHNISYDYKAFEKRHENNGPPKKYTKEGLRLKRLEDINTAIKRSKGVCQDYSRVFEALCEAAGITSKYVRGFVKTTTGGGKHAWNVVKYNGTWQLLDVTFGSGYMNKNKKFVQNFEPNYFFVDPEIFIINHFPREEKWQLLERTIQKTTFENFMPVSRGFLEYGVKGLNQLEHNIRLANNENLILEFETRKPIKAFVCHKLGAQGAIRPKVTVQGLKYRVEIENSKLQNGKYRCFADKKQLFVYNISKL